MTTEQAKTIVGWKNWAAFLKWMSGQTVGMNEDGSTNWYEYDVRRFAEGKRIIYD